MKKTRKDSLKNRADAFWICSWISAGQEYFYENIPDYVIMRAYKNQKRWHNPRSLYAKNGFFQVEDNIRLAFS